MSINEDRRILTDTRHPRLRGNDGVRCMDSRFRGNDETGPRGNDGVFLSGVGVMGQWVPAHAGIQRRETPSRLTRHLIPTQNYLNVIPGLAGMTEYFFRVLG